MIQVMEGKQDTQYEKSNLIINYLPQMLTDIEFKNLFQSIGPVKSAKIVRHKATGYSYGFGFVEYERDVDASRAIETLNGFSLQNKKIKVAYSRPGGDSIKNANLYIRGVPKFMTEDQLEATFAEFGNIVQCRILKNTSGNANKGVGFILYDKREQAEEAIKVMTGKTLDGASEPLTIKYAEDNAKKVRPPMGNVMGNQMQSFSNQMTGRFNAGGPIRQSIQGRFRFNPLTSNISTLGGYSYGQSTALTVGNDGYVLFVYNIGAETDEKTLWQVFARYGSVQKVNVIREGATGAGKGYGFVTMSNYEEAVMAIESLNGFNFFGKPLQVSFKSQK